MRKLVRLTGCLLAFVFAGRSSAASISFGAVITPAGGITFVPSPSEGHSYGDDAIVFNAIPRSACLESASQGCADPGSNAPGGLIPSIQTLNALRSLALNGVTLDSVVTLYGVTLDLGSAGGGGAAGGLGAVRSASAVAALDFFGVGPDFWIDAISAQVQTAAFRERTDSPF